MKVSWQVTGIRQDAYTYAHRIQVEDDKPPQDQGHYLHPELFGAGGRLPRTGDLNAEDDRGASPQAKSTQELLGIGRLFLCMNPGESGQRFSDLLGTALPAGRESRFC